MVEPLLVRIAHLKVRLIKILSLAFCDAKNHEKHEFYLGKDETGNLPKQ